MDNNWTTSHWKKQAGLYVVSLCSKTLSSKWIPPSSSSNTHFLLERYVHIKGKSIWSSIAYFPNIEVVSIVTSGSYTHRKLYHSVHMYMPTYCHTKNVGIAKTTQNHCDPILMQLESKLGCPRDVSSWGMVAKELILVRFLCCLGSGHKKGTQTNFINTDLPLKARLEPFVGVI